MESAEVYSAKADAMVKEAQKKMKGNNRNI
jgi:hypothetical protein